MLSGSLLQQEQQHNGKKTPGWIVTAGVVTIYTNNPGGNLAHKHKTIKFDVVGERPAMEYIKSAEQTKKSRKTASLQITAHIFWRFPKRNGENYLIFQKEFPVFRCKW